MFLPLASPEQALVQLPLVAQHTVHTIEKTLHIHLLLASLLRLSLLQRVLRNFATCMHRLAGALACFLAGSLGPFFCCCYLDLTPNELLKLLLSRSSRHQEDRLRSDRGIVFAKHRMGTRKACIAAL